jgi:nitrogen fixation/metabolism regulation signal transduction histidine kinase
LKYIITTFALIGISLLIFLGKSLSNSDLISNESFRALIFFNAFFIFGLVILIAVQIYKLFNNIRKEIVGSRLTLRLVISFALMVIIPVSVVYLVSFNFLTKSIDSWFNVKVESALQGGLSLGQKTLEILMKDIELKSKSISYSYGNANQDDRTKLLFDLRQKFGISEALVYDQQKNQIIEVAGDQFKVIPELPSSDDLLKAENGFYGKIFEQGDSIFLRAYVPIKIQENISKRYFLELTQPIPSAISKVALSVETVFDEYQQLAYSRTSLKIIYILTLTLVLLLAILSSVALSFVISRRFSSPISQLADATRYVAKGNFKKIIPENGKKDELGLLVKSFNSMTDQLNKATLLATKNRKSLEQSKAFLNSILTNLSSGVIVVEKNLEIILSNIEAYKILECDREFFNDNLNKLIKAKKEFNEIVLFIKNFAISNKNQFIEKEHKILFNKKEKIIRIQVNKIKDFGKVLFVILLDDITEVTKAQRHQAWSEVARRLAHEIKNPLTPIQLSAERLQMKLKGNLSAEDNIILNKSTDTIVDQVESLKIMVNEFADYARPPQLKKESIQVYEFIAKIIDLYSSNKIKFTFTKFNKSLNIDVDKNKLRQVFINLIENSIDALEKIKEPEIKIAFYKKNNLLIFDFIDNGDGIPEDIIHRIYEPYVTSKIKGTGLGLAIVYKIIEEHGGDITIINNKPRGVKVNFRIPYNEE